VTLSACVMDLSEVVCTLTIALLVISKVSCLFSYLSDEDCLFDVLISVFFNTLHLNHTHLLKKKSIVSQTTFTVEAIRRSALHCI
jgi:hypothetical protein